MDTIKQWHSTTRDIANETFINSYLEEGIDLYKIKEKALETDYACIAIIKTKISELFPKMTADLWKQHREKDIMWKINAAQAIITISKNKTK